MYLDGELLGEHYGGWLQFQLGKFVKSGKHTLVVCVDNTPNDFDTFPLKEADWCHFGGITRSIELCEFQKPFIKNAKIGYILSEDLASVLINAKIEIENPFNKEYETTLFCLDGKCRKEQKIRVEKSRVYEIGGIAVEDIKLWDINEGNLCDVRVTLGDDDICDKIGFRRIEAKDKNIYLNGKLVFLKGANRHELHPDRCFAVPSNISKRDVDIFKDLNRNFVRISHYPHAHNFIDYLDREGLCPWLEIPMWQFCEKSLADGFVKKRAKNFTKKWSTNTTTTRVLLSGVFITRLKQILSQVTS